MFFFIIIIQYNYILLYIIIYHLTYIKNYNTTCCSCVLHVHHNTANCTQQSQSLISWGLIQTDTPLNLLICKCSQGKFKILNHITVYLFGHSDAPRDYDMGLHQRVLLEPYVPKDQTFQDPVQKMRINVCWDITELGIMDWEHQALGTYKLL